MDQILPGLWLGSQDAADDLATLERLKITHILSLREPEYQVSIKASSFSQTNLCQYRIWIKDDEDEDISQYFDQTFIIIDAVLSSSTSSILVHCRAGISRSASIVIAYLVRRFSDKFFSVRDVIQWIADECGRTVDPNDGFRAQLERFYWKCQRRYCLLTLLAQRVTEGFLT
jgi:dual specificity phosphatase 12